MRRSHRIFVTKFSTLSLLLSLTSADYFTRPEIRRPWAACTPRNTNHWPWRSE